MGSTHQESFAIALHLKVVRTIDQTRDEVERLRQCVDEQMRFLARDKPGMIAGTIAAKLRINALTSGF